MGTADHFVLGDYNAVCFECGKKKKASQLKKHWKGYMTCEGCWEPRHPQEFVRAAPPEQVPTWTQPAPAPVFIDDGMPEATPYVPEGWDDPTT